MKKTKVEVLTLRYNPKLKLDAAMFKCLTLMKDEIGVWLEKKYREELSKREISVPEDIKLEDVIAIHEDNLSLIDVTLSQDISDYIKEIYDDVVDILDTFYDWRSIDSKSQNKQDDRIRKNILGILTGLFSTQLELLSKYDTMDESDKYLLELVLKYQASLLVAVKR